MKILVAYDGSKCAKDALRELVRSGLPEEAEALVISIAEPWHSPMDHVGRVYDASELADEATALKLADEGRTKLWEQFSGWTIDAEGKRGSVAHQIIERADDWGADLIITGSHGLNSAERFVFGSISQQLVTNAHCSVRIARGNPHREDEPIRLMIGVDGSDDSSLAVEEVLNRHWPQQTKVWLVTAVNSYFDEEANARNRKEFEELHEEITNRMREHGLSSSSIIDHIDPKYLIRRKALEMEVDCIFMGARGLSKFARTLLGSISASISARAGCSVEVVRKRKEK